MIIRRRHTANFTTIGNVLFEDERLKADEVGILAYLLSRPHNWEVRRPALMRRWDMGREAVKRIIGNWVRTGWCVPCKTRRADGTFAMIYEIRDEPGPSLSPEEVRRALSLVSSEAASDEFEVRTPAGEVAVQADPPTGYPSLADPSPGEPYVANKDIQNTDLPKTDSTKKPEREGAGAREKHATNLLKFKRQWPTASSDDQVQIDNAWFALSVEEGEASLAGIQPFLKKLKQDDGRDKVPAGQTYLRQKRWTLLEATAAGPSQKVFALDSTEARALEVVFAIGGKSAFFQSVIRRHGSVNYYHGITPRLLALASEQRRDDWVTLDHRQAGAWEDMVQPFVGTAGRRRVQTGDRAPRPWPPLKDGTWSTVPPPDELMTDQDVADFK